MKKIKISITRDRLQAYMSVSDYNDLKLSDLVAAIQEAGISYGIRGNDIKTAFVNRISNREILIAIGKPAVHGVDGKIECLVNITPESTMNLTDGENEYFPVCITNVTKRQKLFRIIPHSPGLSGVSINGGSIFPKQGKPVKPIKGRNTIFSPYNPNFLISEVDGNLSWDELRANVSQDYKVAGDLGVLNGDIYFIGNLIITGDVKPGIKVRAGGNIEVYGDVEDAVLEADGNISIRGGFFGHGKGKILAKGDVTINIVDNQLVQSSRNITIRKESVNSHLNAFSIKAGDASIFGGSITAFDSIEVQELGRSQNVITKVTIGSKLHKMNMIRAVENEIRSIEQRSKKINDSANYLLAKRMKMGFITPEEELDYLLCKDDLKDMAAKMKTQMDRREFLISKLNDRVHSRLEVFASIYPNVLLSINDIRGENSRVYSNSVFFEKDNSVFRATLPNFQNI
jgi:uncharacterized protein